MLDPQDFPEEPEPARWRNLQATQYVVVSAAKVTLGQVWCLSKETSSEALLGSPNLLWWSRAPQQLASWSSGSSRGWTQDSVTQLPFMSGLGELHSPLKIATVQ